MTSRFPDLGRAQHLSADAEVLRDLVAALTVSHTVEPLRGVLDGATVGIRLGEVSLAFVRYGAPARIIADPTGERFCWTIPIGAMDVEMDGTEGRLSQGFLLNPQSSTVMVPNPLEGAVIVTTSTAALQRRLQLLSGLDAPQIEPVPGPSRASTGGRVDQAWRYVSGIVGSLPSMPEPLKRSLGEHMLTALLLELPSTSHLLMAKPPSRPAAQHAQRAAEWAATHFHQPVTVEMWAKAVSISVRHLQEVMKEHFGAAPKDYLLTLRLDHARRMIAERPERTITSIALSSGFAHLGRFSAQYRERFGVTPSEDRLRS